MTVRLIHRSDVTEAPSSEALFPIEGAFAGWGREGRALAIWHYRFRARTWRWIGETFGITGSRAHEIVTDTPIGERTLATARQLEVLLELRRFARSETERTAEMQYATIFG